MTRWALCVGLSWSNAASAISITPVLVELTPARRVASVAVTNPGPSKTFQAELLSWTQHDGADQYAHSDDLIVTPAIAQVGAGETQIFRVALRGKPQAQVERAYRLILEDITEDGAATDIKSAINLRFRFSLPVMAAPSASVHSALRWSWCPALAGKSCVRLDNDGNQRIRLSTLSLEGGGGWHQEFKGAGTVLAGAWKQWTFDLPSRELAPLHLSAKVEGGTLQGELTPPP